MTSPDGFIPTGAFVGAAAASNNISSIGSVSLPSTESALSSSILQSFSNVQVNAGALVQAGIDELLANLLRALANIEILGSEPFAFLNQWANDLDTAAKTALSTAAKTVQGITGSSDSSQVAPTVTAIQSNIATTASAVAGLQTQATASSVGGASVTATFTGTLTGSLGPGWTLGGNTTAPWATAGGAAGLSTSANYPDGTRYALSTTAMLTTDHHVQLVAANAGYYQAMTSLVVRAKSDMSSFAYLNVFQNEAYLGYGSWNGSSWTFTDWASTAISLAVGNTVTLTAQGNHYTAAINGQPILAHSDTTNTLPVTAANVQVGWLSEQFTDIFGNRYTGWNINSFNAADLSAPPVVGTGWALFQSTSTAVALPGSTWQQLGAGTFDTERQLSNVTVNDLGRGVVAIQKAGWYSVSFNCNVTSAAGTSNQFCAGIYQTPSSGSLTLVRSGPSVEGNQVYAVGASNVIYCNVGDLLQPAMWQAGSNSLVGDAAGASTYFEGALISGS